MNRQQSYILHLTVQISTFSDSSKVGWVTGAAWLTVTTPWLRRIWFERILLKLNLQKKVLFFANKFPSLGIFANKKAGNQKN